MALVCASIMHLMHVMADPARIFDDGSMEKQTHPRPWPINLTCLSSIVAVSLATFLLATMAGPVDAQEEVWAILLGDQLLAEKKCELNYTTNLRKFELSGQQALDVRAHCKDKRAFDASWLPDKQRYELRQCEPLVC